MDFDAKANDIAGGLLCQAYVCQGDDKKWQRAISIALRDAYKAGQRDTREKAAEICWPTGMKLWTVEEIDGMRNAWEEAHDREGKYTEAFYRVAHVVLGIARRTVEALPPEEIR